MNEDAVEKNVQCIKEFIQTFYFAKNIEIIIDKSNLKETNKKYKENNSKIINLFSSYSIWLCMNEIYPSWFDISIHPAQFDTELDAYECLLKYINEYHENKYNKITKNIMDNLSNMTLKEFTDIYSLIILAALVSEEKQKHINNILSVSHRTQKYIHHIVELLDVVESSNKDQNLFIPDDSKDVKNKLESMKNEIKQLKKKVKFLEMENENLNNSLTDKNKIIKENIEKMNNLQNQINLSNEKSKMQYISQIEEQDKKILELQNNLDKEIKDKSHLENVLNNRIKELEDEQNILKQENLNIDDLQNKINKYKEKLESFMTVQNLNKELEERLKSKTQKIVDMESEMEKLKIESNNIKKYKDKISDLDSNLVNTQKENDKLKQDISEKNKTLEKLRRDLDAKTLSYDMLKKEKNIDHYNIGLCSVDHTEELIRIKKENEKLKNQIGLDKNEESKTLNELENEIDELRRINKKLELKISESIDKGNADNDTSLRGKYEELLKEIEEKQKEIKELNETNKNIMLKMANIQGNSDPNLNEKLIRLEAELLIEKKNNEQIEETAKNKLSKEFNAVLQLLKDQLQIREKETEYYKNALKTQIDITNDEQKLLSGIIQNLGLKYKQLQTYNLSLRNEITGIKLRSKTYPEAEEK